MLPAGYMSHEGKRAKEMTKQKAETATAAAKRLLPPGQDEVCCLYRPYTFTQPSRDSDHPCIRCCGTGLANLHNCNLIQRRAHC